VSKLSGGEGDRANAESRSTSGKDERLTTDAEVEEVFQKLLRVAAKQGFGSWSPALKRDLMETELNKVAKITEKLKELRAAAAKGKEKLDLWTDLKVETFAQCVAVVWGISLLNAFLCVQLMVIARISTLHEESPGSEMKYHDVRTLLEKELEQGMQGFLERNLREICLIATEASGQALASTSLKRMMTFKDVLSTLACISSTAEFQISKNGWGAALARPRSASSLGEEGEKRDVLLQFHSNVNKVIRGQDFEHAVSVSAMCVSDILMAKCENLFAMQSDRAQGRENQGGPGVGVPRSLPLAKVIPLVSAATEEVLEDSNPIIEYEVSRLPEVVRAYADAFSVHAA